MAGWPRQTPERQVEMEHSYTLELFAREQIGDWRREADRHRLAKRTPRPRLAAWPLFGRIVHLVLRMATVT